MKKIAFTAVLANVHLWMTLYGSYGCHIVFDDHVHVEYLDPIRFLLSHTLSLIHSNPLLVLENGFEDRAITPMIMNRLHYRKYYYFQI